MSLKKIDFSDGIRAEEIQNNFEDLQAQIDRERKSVGGAGIASGLEITPIVTQNEFAIEVSKASIIGKDGQEIYIDKQKINIELPKLAKEIEYLTSNASNQIKLRHTPYSLNRRMTVETHGMFTPQYSGIDIKYRDSIAQDDYIRVRAINGNTVSLTGLTRRDLVVTYHYTGKRIDTVYIDKNDKLKVISSTTSPTPSVMMPNDYKYLIAFIEIDGAYTDEEGRTYANIVMRKDLRDVRNIYTDLNGDLWLCGIPFKDLQIIHMTEPKDPKEFTMWYDTCTNQLKTWRSTDELVYMNEYIVTTDYVNNPDVAKDYPTDMYYYVGKKQLSVYVNDIQLDEEQFDELINGVPADIKDIDKKTMSNTFRIYTDLRIGDKIVYKITNFDEHKMWVPVNHSSYVNVKDIKQFSPDSEEGGANYFATEKAIALGKDENLYPYRYQYFLFDRHKDLNMLFTPGKHELEIMVNQTPLHADQFEEITIYDLYGQDLPQSIIDAAGVHYGWTYAELEKYSGEYENTGIGFKLIQPLDAALAEEENGAMDLYIEASVQRRVNDGPLKRKLQRTATFVKEGYAEVNEDRIIDIPDAYYLYGENQLEVYHNGKRLRNTVDFIEGTDLSDQDDMDEEGNVTALAPRRIGAKTKQFTIINSNIDAVTYKITTSIYSYDHVNQLIDELDYNALTAVKKVDELYDKTVDIQNRVQATIDDLAEELEEVKDIANDLDGKYLTKDSIISISQMPPIMVSNMVQSLNHISTSITFNAGKTEYSIKSDVREEDFVMAIKRDITNQLDKFFIRGVDYSIYNTVSSEGAYEDTILSISSSAAALMNTGDIIILTGIKFGKAGRE